MRAASHGQKVQPGLYKPKCKHGDWRKCSCSWYAWSGKTRVCLSKWWMKSAPAGAGTIATYAEALRAYSAFKEAVTTNMFRKDGQRQEEIRANAGKLDKALDDYIASAAFTSLSSTTQDSYKVYIGYFREWFGEERIVEIARFPVEWKTRLDKIATERKWKPRSANRVIQFGRRFFNWARKPYGVRDNPFADDPDTLRMDHAAEGELRDVRFTAEQVTKLTEVSAFDPPMHARLLCALQTGLRVEEMLNVQNKDVDARTWEIKLPPRKTKGGKTTGKRETVAIDHPKLRAFVKERLKVRGPEGYVFGHADGTQLNEDVFRTEHAMPLFAAAKVPWGRDLEENPEGRCWHDLRHEFCSRVGEAPGMTLPGLQAVLRVQDIKTAMRYWHADKIQIRKIMHGIW